MRPYDDVQYAQTLLHEFGHAFAKLADEYVNEERKWDDPESGKENLMGWQNSGYNRNVSIYSDVTKTTWADFAADRRYDFEKLGCYEGGDYQEKGVDVHNGATWYNGTMVDLDNNSLGADAMGQTKKPFIHAIDPKTGCAIIVKTAGFAVTNDLIRGSETFARLNKHMNHRIKWTDSFWTSLWLYYLTV
jgi:hypothetical protein